VRPVFIPLTSSTVRTSVLRLRIVRRRAPLVDVRSPEEYRGEKVKSFDLALRLAPEIKLETLVGPRFRLEEYREAIATARAAGREGHVKVVFDHRAAG